MKEDRPKYSLQIKRIMREFDFDKVRRAMCALAWTWRENLDSPTEKELREVATKLLQSVSRTDQYGHTHATGGFEANLDYQGVLTLQFTLEHWDGSNETNGIEEENDSQAG